MSEELTPDHVATESAPTEAPPAQDPTPQSMNMDSTVRVGGEDYSVADLVDMAKRGAQAEEYSSHASVLMRPDASDSEKETSIRYLMDREGYTPEQIEDYVANLNNNQAQDNQGQNEGPDPFEQYQRQMESRMNKLEEKQSKVGIDFLRSRLGETVSKAMQENSQIQTLLNKSRELNGDEGFADREKNIKAQLEAQIIDNLRTRKGRGETFNVSWFNDEANSAADTIYNRIRSVIGDPDKIGRSPETASETEMLFSNTKPVAEPTYEKGDTVGSVDTKVRDWNTDALSRLAVDLNTGDETKA